MTYEIVSLSLPVNLRKKIDSERGDVPRSRYILRILEKAIRTEMLPGGKL